MKTEIWWTIESKYGFTSAFHLLRKEAIAAAVKDYTFYEKNETWKDLKKRGYRAVKVEVRKIK